MNSLEVRFLKFSVDDLSVSTGRVGAVDVVVEAAVVDSQPNHHLDMCEVIWGMVKGTVNSSVLDYYNLC